MTTFAKPQTANEPQTASHTAATQVPSSVSSPPSLIGRRALLVSTSVVAVLAAGAGAGLAWRNMRGAGSSDVQPSPAAGLWALEWPTPQGQKLQMQGFKGRPLLLNFWAPWCPPCVEELPLIQDFYRQHASAGWQVLGLALDTLAPVQAFLRKVPLDFPVGLAGLVGLDLARNLGNLTGALPFSVVFGADGIALHLKMGRLTQADLDAWVRLK